MKNTSFTGAKWARAGEPTAPWHKSRRCSTCLLGHFAPGGTLDRRIVGLDVPTGLQPLPESGMVDQQAESEMEWVKAFILGIRKIKASASAATT